MIKVEMNLDDEQLWHAWFALETAAQKMGKCQIGTWLHSAAEDLRLAFYYHYEKEIEQNKRAEGRWVIPSGKEEG